MTTLKDLNNLPMPNVLTWLNIPIAKETAGSITAPATWRNETNPSFSIEKSTNRGKDFGTGERFSNIDLVCRVLNLGIHEAAEWLKRMSGDGNWKVWIPPTCTTSPKSKQSKIEIVDVKEIAPYSPLYYYLTQRGLTNWRPYIKRVDYRNGDRTYYACGWRGTDSGWHLRSKTAKLCTSQAPTFIDNECNELLACEGMIDLLSLYELFPACRTAFDAISLNSLSNTKKLPEIATKYNKVHLIFDNDQAGNEHTIRMLTEIPQAVDERHLLHGAADVNDYLMIVKNLKIN